MVRFEDIRGNEAAVKHFQTALRTESISHAYLISGSEGSGKNMLADAFTAALLCEEGSTEACGHCKSCLQAASGNHPDIFRITHEKSIISVNEIREQLNANVAVKPYSSAYKVFIVDEAELMNEAAQNALLKTLEEPPEYVVIMLLSASEEALLSTIRSRCILLNTRPLTKSEVSSYLSRNYSMPDYQAEVAAAFSGGYLGKAIAFATDEEGEALRESLLSMLRSFDEMTLAELGQIVKLPAEKRDAALDLFLIWLRDVMLYKSTKSDKKLILKNESRTIARAAELRSYEALEQAVKALEETRSNLENNVNADLSMELLLMAMRDRQV